MHKINKFSRDVISWVWWYNYNPNTQEERQEAQEFGASLDNIESSRLTCEAIRILSKTTNKQINK